MEKGNEMKWNLLKLWPMLVVALSMLGPQRGSGYYDPEVQRWINRDPLGERGGVNLYGYVGNDPVNAMDPAGLELMNNPLYVGPMSLEEHERFVEGAEQALIEMSEYLNELLNGSQDPNVISAAFPDYLIGTPARAISGLKSALGWVKKCFTRQAAKKMPQKVTDTLKHIQQTGQPPPGYVGGRTFKNAEGRLPAGGRYKEYDVDPKPPAGTRRNAERVVVDEKTGQAWYTDDHYGSFTEVK